jgi:hypothetical protein
MPGSWYPADFPNLDPQNHEVTSGITRRYNCLAWAAHVTKIRWEPDPDGQYYWPLGVPRQYTTEAFVEAYRTIGFRLCFSGASEEGIEKLAIFAEERNGKLRPTHAALQLESGRWTSKIGDLEDISHETDACVGGGLYGTVFCYMQRPRPKESHIANRGLSLSTNI